METKLTIMSQFFEDPNRRFHIRELARILKINHTTIRQYLNGLVKENLLVVEKTSIYPLYRILFSRKYINLKLFYNLEKLRKSGILEEMEKNYDLSVIVLFGSYAHSIDYKDSDIDLCIISPIEKEFKVEKYEKILNRKISIHLFTKESWKKARKKNPGLINSICNGIVLSRELEVL